MRIVLFLALVLAACGDMTVDPPSSRGPGGGAPLYCPSTADYVATQLALPLPFPANPQNPTPYDPSLPPPYFYDGCLNSAGALTSRNGMPCMVCTDATHFYNQLLPGDQICTQDTSQRDGAAPLDPNGTPYQYIVCVPAAVTGNVLTCNPGAWGCS